METVWVQQRTVISAHDESLAEHGGPSGIRDMGLLEPALARPKNILAYSEEEPSLQRLAAAYAFWITADNPFVDGDKRTALIVSLTFLKLNGVLLTADKTERYLTFYGVAAGTITEESLTEWFMRNTSPIVK